MGKITDSFSLWTNNVIISKSCSKGGEYNNRDKMENLLSITGPSIMAANLAKTRDNWCTSNTHITQSPFLPIVCVSKKLKSGRGWIRQKIDVLYYRGIIKKGGTRSNRKNRAAIENCIIGWKGRGEEKRRENKFFFWKKKIINYVPPSLSVSAERRNKKIKSNKWNIKETKIKITIKEGSPIKKKKLLILKYSSIDLYIENSRPRWRRRRGEMLQRVRRE